MSKMNNISVPSRQRITETNQAVETNCFSFSLGPAAGLDLYAHNLGEDNSIVIG